MNTKIIHEKGCVRLILDDPKKEKDDSDILAQLTCYADSSCWQLEDIRLTKHRAIDQYWCQSADAYRASYLPENEDEANYLKSKLREYQEQPNGELMWSSFHGIVKGQPEINGYRPARYADFNQTGYFSRKEGLQKLDEIKVFWDGLGSLDENWRIDNPNAQPTESSIWSLCGIRRMYIDSIGGIDEEKNREIFENLESQLFTENNNNLAEDELAECFLGMR